VGDESKKAKDSLTVDLHGAGGLVFRVFADFFFFFFCRGRVCVCVCVHTCCVYVYACLCKLASSGIQLGI
jgi:hypothetical protein